MSAESFDQYAERRARALLGLAYVLTGSVHDAEDLAQEALLRTQANWDKVAKAKSADRYVRRLLTNLYISQQRRRRIREVTLSAVNLGRSDTVPDASSVVETREAVIQAVSQLPPRQRAIIVLKYYEALDTAEIADAMAINEASVRSALARALRTLQAALHDPAYRGSTTHA